MSMVIKTYVGIFLLLLSVVSMTSIFFASLESNRARDYHAATLAQIADANFAPSVVAACKTQAEKNGYELLIEEGSMVRDEMGKPTMMEVILQYEQRIDFFGVVREQQIRGFAR